MSGPRPPGRRAAADVLAQLGGRAVNLALGLVVTIVLVRALGDERFGQWATILAVVEIVGYFGLEYSLEKVAVSRAAAEGDRARDWLGGLVMLRLALTVPVTLAAAGLLLLIAEDDEMRAAALLLSGTILVGSLNSARTVFQLRVRNDVNVAVVLVNSVLWTAAAIALAVADADMVAFAAAFLAAATLSAALQLVLGLRGRGLALARTRSLWPALLRAGVPLGVAGLLTIAYTRVDQVIVFELAGASDAGLYGAVYRMLDRAQFVPIAIATTLLPIIAAAYAEDRARVQRLFQLAVDYLAMASLPALAVTVVAAEPIVRLLFGAEFEDAAPALPILMGAFVAISFAHLAINMVVVLELHRPLALYALTGLVVNVALNLALVPEYGFLAAAWITLLTEVLVLSLSMRAVLGALALRPAIGRLARTAAGAAAMALAVLALRGAGAGAGLLLAAAALTYPPLLLAFRALERGELSALLRREQQ